MEIVYLYQMVSRLLQTTAERGTFQIQLLKSSDLLDQIQTVKLQLHFL